MSINYDDYSDILTKREISFLKKNGSLADRYPDAIQFWDVDRNGDLTPFIVPAHSNRSVFWKCDVCGYEWEATILNRGKAKLCPVCCGQKVMTGYNDFATFFPDIALEWDAQNDELEYNPATVAVNSHKKGKWKCRTCGHQWTATFENRANGQGCKACGYYKVGNKVTERALSSRGSLYENYPELVKEWNYEKNVEIDPQKIAVSSKQKVWWRCKICDHEWMASVGARSGLYKTGCPECNRKKEKSNLQLFTETYIKEKYCYELLHEYGCTIIATNPITNKKLPYDNELIIGDRHLIIEVQGDQHYRVTNFSIYSAKLYGITPEEYLARQQYRDLIKKEYVLSMQNYYFLEIPYYAYRDNSYKALIDNKIQEILSTIQN